MAKKTFSIEFIEKKIRQKSFGIIGTVSEKGWVQSSGVLYGVSEPSDEFALYILTGKDYKKTKNITKNSHVSFVIPFPHYYFRFTPSSTIQFQAQATIVPVTDKMALHSFSKKKILKMMIDWTDDDPNKDQYIFIKLTPVKRFICYGVGYSIFYLARNSESATYQVELT